MRIVLVEDNTLLASGLARALSDEGHAVECFIDGRDALDFLIREGFDLAVLDINLPSLSGLDILREIRLKYISSPVLLLTARDQTKDRVEGLDAGADDYLVKPFAMEEFEARVRALLRRRTRPSEFRIKLGALEFDRAARRAFVNGNSLNLPRKELAVLECLVDRSQCIVSKDELADHLYGVGAPIENRVVEIYVSRLRKQLHGSNVEIRTIRGLGYMLETEG